MSQQSDRIIMDGLSFYGYHGLFEEEAQLGQRFVVDVALEVDVERPGRSGQMADSVHYGQVYERIRSLVEGQPFRLIEQLAVAIADDLLAHFERIEGLEVRVKKPQAPVPGIFNHVAVEIYRHRQDKEDDHDIDCLSRTGQ